MGLLAEWLLPLGFMSIFYGRRQNSAFMTSAGVRSLSSDEQFHGQWSKMGEECLQLSLSLLRVTGRFVSKPFGKDDFGFQRMLPSIEFGDCDSVPFRTQVEDANRVGEQRAKFPGVQGGFKQARNCALFNTL